MNIIPLQKVRAPRVMGAFAYHEAGHAVVAYEMNIHVDHVTIVPDADCDGACWISGRDYRNADPTHQAAVDLAGEAAERLSGMTGGFCYRAVRDVECMLRAYDIQHSVAASRGWTPIRLQEFRAKAHRDASGILLRRWGYVCMLAKMLLSRTRIDSTEIHALFRAPIGIGNAPVAHFQGLRCRAREFSLASTSNPRANPMSRVTPPEETLVAGSNRHRPHNDVFPRSRIGHDAPVYLSSAAAYPLLEVCVCPF
jgi:hypothetical protein